MATFRDLLSATKAEIVEVDTAEGQRRVDDGAVLLDVREPDERDQGAVPGSLHVVRGNLEAQIEVRVPDRSTPRVRLPKLARPPTGSAEAMHSRPARSLPIPLLFVVRLYWTRFPSQVSEHFCPGAFRIQAVRAN